VLTAAVAVLVLAVLGVLLWLFQPWALVVDRTVDEAFPVVAPAEPDAVASVAASPAASPAASAIPTTSPASPAPAPTATASPTPAPPPPGPVALLTGAFVSRDHVTSGTATVYELADGSMTLRIEALATDNGPDLYVYLDDDAGDAPQDGYDDGLDLGRLKGNIGDQNYAIPAGTDLEVLTTVVIWCDRFSSAFGTVDLVPAT
jgi:hypothetical protein